MSGQERVEGLSRRDFLQRGALAAAGTAFLGAGASASASPPHADLEEATIEGLQLEMREGRLSSATPNESMRSTRRDPGCARCWS